MEKTEKFLVGGLLRLSGTGYPVIGGAAIPGEGGTIGGDGNGTLVVGTEKLHTCRAKFVQSLCMGMSVGIAGFAADDGIGGRDRIKKCITGGSVASVMTDFQHIRRQVHAGSEHIIFGFFLSISCKEEGIAAVGQAQGTEYENYFDRLTEIEESYYKKFAGQFTGK